MPPFSLLLVAVILSFLPHCFAADEKPASEPTASSITDTNLASATDTQMLNHLLQLQEQLRTTQKAVDQAREQAQADARRAEGMLASRLNLIEQTLQAQRASEMAELQKSTRTVVMIAFVVTALGLIAVLFAGFAQAKAMTRLAEVSSELRGMAPALQLTEGGTALLPAARESLEAANAQVLGAIDRLQKRLEDMEAAAAGT